MGEKPQPFPMTRVQLNITIFTAKDANLDRGVTKPTPTLCLPFIPQPHQQILIFVGLQVPLLALRKKRTKGPPHQDNEGCVPSSAETLLTGSGALLFLACVCCNIYRSWKMKPHFTAKWSFCLFLFRAALKDKGLLVAFHSPGQELFRLQKFLPC